MKKARAAELWARLEKRLIERCGLPNGAMLDRERPGLVRAVGSFLSGKATAGDTVSPPLPEQTGKPPFVQVAGTRGMVLATPELRLDDSAPALTFKSTPRADRIPRDTIHDPKLAAMLERACSLRGYDGEDSVGY